MPIFAYHEKSVSRPGCILWLIRPVILVTRPSIVERGEDKGHYRWGSQKGSIYVQGQKKAISRPRVMKKEKVNGKRKEVDLETYKAFSRPDSMNESMLVKLLAGVSMRDYAGTVEQVVERHGE